jgi:F0F1-type ATP synthase membrane subunit b/b'
MSEELVERPFDEASEQMEAEHKRAMEELKTKVEKAKSAALKKVSP